MSKREHLTCWNKKTGKIVPPDILRHQDKKDLRDEQPADVPAGALETFARKFDQQIRKAVRESK